jgi:hypothetical protein
MSVKKFSCGAVGFIFSAFSVSLLSVFLIDGLPPSRASNNSPPIKMSMYLVPATEACKPNGYFRPNEFKGKLCGLISEHDINFFEMKRMKLYRALKGLDNSISLDKMLGPIDAIYKEKGNAPRMATVMVYDFGNLFQNVNQVRIQLKVLDSSGVTIRDYGGNNRPIYLRNPSAFIDHHRADDFIPANQYTWYLKAGQFEWKFQTAP